MEGRGTGVWGMTMQGGGQAFNYGWPKYGPVSPSEIHEMVRGLIGRCH